MNVFCCDCEHTRANVRLDRIMASSMVCELKKYVRNQFEVGQFQDFAMAYVSEVADGH